MCGFTAAAIGLQLLSGASQAGAASAQGQQAQQVAEYNASVSEAQARDALQRGEAEASQQRTRTRQQIGRQATAIAGAGLDVSRGTALDVFADTAAIGSMDEQTIRSNAMREAYGYRTQAQSQRFQGQGARAAGRAQSTSSLLTAGTRGFRLWDEGQ